MGGMVKVLLVVSLLGMSAAAQTTPGRVWKVHLAEGTDTELTVSYSSGIIEFHNPKTIAFAIPAASIEGIFHTTERFWRSSRATSWTDSGAHQVELQVAKDDYLPFMDWLRQLSRKNWQDLDQERAIALKQIEQRA